MKMGGFSLVLCYNMHYCNMRERYIYTRLCFFPTEFIGYITCVYISNVDARCVRPLQGSCAVIIGAASVQELNGVFLATVCMISIDFGHVCMCKHMRGMRI